MRGNSTTREARRNLNPYTPNMTTHNAANARGPTVAELAELATQKRKASAAPPVAPCQAGTTAARLSVFRRHTNKMPTGEITMKKFIGQIQDGTHADAIGRVRTAVACARGDGLPPDEIKKRVAPLKAELEAVTLSGRVTTGNRAQAFQEGRFEHSGWLQLDLDAADLAGADSEAVRYRIGKDPHILAAALSPTGEGVKAIMRGPVCKTPAEHLRFFLAAAAYMLATYGLPLDQSTKDAGRVCYVTHDPQVTWNDKTAALDVAQWAPEEPAQAPHATPAAKREVTRPGTAPAAAGGLTLRNGNGTRETTPEDVRAMLAVIPPRPVYTEWLRIASAVWDATDEATGTALLNAWSPEEKPGEYAEKFKHRLTDVHTGTLVMLAKEHGWTPPSGTVVIDRPTGKVSIPTHQAFFYDGPRYYFDSGKDFIPMDVASVSRHLLSRGIPKEAIQSILCKIQVEGFIHFAGPLAGYQRGIHLENGCRLLASTSPHIIPANAGQWPTLDAVIRGLLAQDEGDFIQVETFLGWLKFARESLVTGRRRPGQALALAGPRNCGKSLLIDVVEAALGGRRCNPYQYFTARTSFNGDIAGAELLAIDDEAGSTDFRARKALAASIKSNLFAGAVRIEGKHKNAFTFRPCWRMILALNDEPESLLVLPPITEDIADKLTLLKCHKAALPMPAHTMEQRQQFFAQLMAELPALLDWLEKWDVPADLREERCGVTHYHHPDLLGALLELSPEGQLAGLIDSAESLGGIELPWSGTAAEFSKLLCACPGIGQAAQQLLGHWQPACGVYLGKLQGTGKVHRLTLLRGIQRWRVLGGGVVE